MKLLLQEYVTQQLKSLNETELQQVSEYVAFLKYRARGVMRQSFDPKQIAAFYAEFSEEDSDLAEEGMPEYADGLLMEDRL